MVRQRSEGSRARLYARQTPIKEQLVLHFALGGNVKIRLIDKSNLALITPQGKNLRYEGLKAWVSKEGRDLNARLQLKETHCNFKTP
jgi:hypothetical protein